MGPWTFAWIWCPHLCYHPCQNGTLSTSFCNTRGHNPIDFAFPCVPCGSASGGAPKIGMPCENSQGMFLLLDVMSTLKASPSRASQLCTEHILVRNRRGMTSLPPDEPCFRLPWPPPTSPHTVRAETNT